MEDNKEDVFVKFIVLCCQGRTRSTKNIYLILEFFYKKKTEFAFDNQYTYYHSKLVDDPLWLKSILTLMIKYTLR